MKYNSKCLILPMLITCSMHGAETTVAQMHDIDSLYQDLTTFNTLTAVRDDARQATSVSDGKALHQAVMQRQPVLEKLTTRVSAITQDLEQTHAEITESSKTVEAHKMAIASSDEFYKLANSLINWATEALGASEQKALDLICNEATKSATESTVLPLAEYIKASRAVYTKSWFFSNLPVVKELIQDSITERTICDKYETASPKERDQLIKQISELEEQNNGRFANLIEEMSKAALTATNNLGKKNLIEFAQDTCQQKTHYQNELTNIASHALLYLTNDREEGVSVEQAIANHTGCTAEVAAKLAQAVTAKVALLNDTETYIVTEEEQAKADAQFAQEAVAQLALSNNTETPEAELTEAAKEEQENPALVWHKKRQQRHASLRNKSKHRKKTSN